MRLSGEVSVTGTEDERQTGLNMTVIRNILETEQNNVRAITPHGKWPTRIPHTSYTTTSNLLHIPPHNWKYM